MNEKDATYCRQCGQQLDHQQAHQQKKKKKKKNRHHNQPSQPSPIRQPGLLLKTMMDKPFYYVLGIVGLAMVLVFTREVIQSARTPERARVTEQKTNNPAVESAVLAVASKFVCSCGTCGEIPLESCTCETAIEERQFVRDRIVSGQDLNVVTAALALTYGSPKPAFAEEVTALTSKESAQSASDAQSPPIGTKKAATAVTAVATLLDRNEVFSHFTCPCGQCGIDELLYCDCSHPKGAREVKKYVDDLIRSNTKSVKDVVEAVDAKYGGRKF